jgi:hypothetical protein
MDRPSVKRYKASAEVEALRREITCIDREIKSWYIGLCLVKSIGKYNPPQSAMPGARRQPQIGDFPDISVNCF